MSGCAFQQRAPHSTQNAQFELNIDAAKVALAEGGRMMASLPAAIAAEIRPKLEVIRIQLAKSEPSPA